MRSHIAVGSLVFIALAIATWFLIPLQPRRVLHASKDPDRVFVRVLPGGRWALTARVKKQQDSFGRLEVASVAPIRLYDLRRGRECLELIASGEMWSRSLAKLSADGRLLAVSVQDAFPSSQLFVWDLESSALLATLPRHNTRSMEPDRDLCQLSPDGRLIAYATSAQTQEASEQGPGRFSEQWHLRLWNKETGSDVEIGPFSSMSLVAFSPDSTQIANGFAVFSTSDGSEQTTLKLQAPFMGPIVSQWTPDGKDLVLIAPTYDPQQPTRIDVTFWSPATGETQTRVLSSDPVLRLDSASFSHDGTYLFLHDRTVGASELWDIGVDPPTRVGYSRAEDFCTTAEMPFAVLGENAVTQRLWKLGKPVDQATIMLASEIDIDAIQFNADRSLVSISHSDPSYKRVLEIWSTSSMKRISRVELEGRFAGFSDSGNTFFEWSSPESSSHLREWDIHTPPPWIWLMSTWIVEAVIVVGLTRWLARRPPRAAQGSGSQLIQETGPTISV